MKKILFSLLCLIIGINFVSADTIDVRYITDYTDIKLFNSINAEYDIPKQTTNSVISGITKILITIDHSFDNDLEYEVELATPNAKLNTNINKVQALGYNITCQLTAVDLTSFGSEFPLIRFKCPATTPFIILSLENMGGNVITTADNFRWNWSYLRYIIDNSISDATQSIITNDNQNTQDIINNQDQNTQDIIDAQNQNTQDIIDSNKVCNNYDINTIKTDKHYLFSIDNSSPPLGNEVSSNNWGITDYIRISEGAIITTLQTYTTTTNSGLCFYNINKSIISCVNSRNTNETITIPSGSSYVRFSINKNENKPQFKVCNNGNQATNDAINGLNDSLTDDSSIDMSGIGNTAGWLPAGPIDSIINLPLNFFNSISSALSGVCQPLIITIPFLSQTIQIPCLSTIFGQISGLIVFWNWVGRIASVYILYRYLLSLWDYYDRLTTLQVNFRDDFGGGV